MNICFVDCLTSHTCGSWLLEISLIKYDWSYSPIAEIFPSTSWGYYMVTLHCRSTSPFQPFCFSSLDKYSYMVTEYCRSTSWPQPYYLVLWTHFPLFHSLEWSYDCKQQERWVIFLALDISYILILLMILPNTSYLTLVYCHQNLAYNIHQKSIMPW